MDVGIDGSVVVFVERATLKAGVTGRDDGVTAPSTGVTVDDDVTIGDAVTVVSGVEIGNENPPFLSSGAFGTVFVVAATVSVAGVTITDAVVLTEGKLNEIVGFVNNGVVDEFKLMGAVEDTDVRVLISFASLFSSTSFDTLSASTFGFDAGADIEGA